MYNLSWGTRRCHNRTIVVSNSPNQQFNWQLFPLFFLHFFFVFVFCFFVFVFGSYCFLYNSFNQSTSDCQPVKYVITGKVVPSSSASQTSREADATNCCGWPIWSLRIRNDNLPNTLCAFYQPDWKAKIETYSQTNKVR